MIKVFSRSGAGERTEAVTRLGYGVLALAINTGKYLNPVRACPSVQKLSSMRSPNRLLAEAFDGN